MLGMPLGNFKTSLINSITTNSSSSSTTIRSSTPAKSWSSRLQPEGGVAKLGILSALTSRPP